MAMTATAHRKSSNRATRRRERRRGNTLTHAQAKYPGWVGRRRYLFGIRSSHPWAHWPLRKIARADIEDCGTNRLRKDLRAIQVALAGYGVTG